MWKLYDIFVTMHKVIVHLYGFQQMCMKIFQTLKYIHLAITHVEEWKMRYKGDTLYLHNMLKPWAELDKAQIQNLIWNYEQLPPLITNIEVSYTQLFKSLDVIVRRHKIHSIGSLTQAMKKNQVLFEVERYMEQLMGEATSNDLQLREKNMQKYISGPTTLRKMLHMLQDQSNRGSETIYLDTMGTRVCFQKDITKQ